MRILFDQNLSPKLVDELSDLFPDSQHVSFVGLARATDTEIWEYARKNIFLIASRDSDFNELILQKGFPPKVIWIRRGNCTTAEIEQIIRSHTRVITDLEKSDSLGLLMLY